VTVPAIKRLFAATLDAASAESVAILRGAASFNLAPGEGGLFYADGTADGLFRIVSASGGAIAIADVTGLQAELDALAAGIAGKADASHTHAQSEITNLVSDPAGKSAVGHGHAASEITGRPIAVAMFLTGTGTNGEQALRFVVPDLAGGARHRLPPPHSGPAGRCGVPVRSGRCRMPTGWRRSAGSATTAPSTARAIARSGRGCASAASGPRSVGCCA
jgi:hypothetical protein